MMQEDDNLKLPPRVETEPSIVPYQHKDESNTTALNKNVVYNIADENGEDAAAGGEKMNEIGGFGFGERKMVPSEIVLTRTTTEQLHRQNNEGIQLSQQNPTDYPQVKTEFFSSVESPNHRKGMYDDRGYMGSKRGRGGQSSACGTNKRAKTVKQACNDGYGLDVGHVQEEPEHYNSIIPYPPNGGGLTIRLKSVNGFPIVMEYTRNPNDGAIRNLGDGIVAINGVDTHDMPLDKIAKVMQKSESTGYINICLLNSKFRRTTTAKHEHAAAPANFEPSSQAQMMHRFDRDSPKKRAAVNNNNNATLSKAAETAWNTPSAWIDNSRQTQHHRPRNRCLHIRTRRLPTTSNRSKFQHQETLTSIAAAATQDHAPATSPASNQLPKQSLRLPWSQHPASSHQKMNAAGYERWVPYKEMNGAPFPGPAIPRALNSVRLPSLEASMPSLLPVYDNESLGREASTDGSNQCIQGPTAIMGASSCNEVAEPKNQPRNQSGRVTKKEATEVGFPKDTAPPPPASQLSSFVPEVVASSSATEQDERNNNNYNKKSNKNKKNSNRYCISLIERKNHGFPIETMIFNGAVYFTGYRRTSDGRRSPEEVSGLIRNLGDRIVAIDGVPTTTGMTDKSLAKVMSDGSAKKGYQYGFGRKRK